MGSPLHGAPPLGQGRGHLCHKTLPSQIFQRFFSGQHGITHEIPYGEFCSSFMWFSIENHPARGSQDPKVQAWHSFLGVGFLPGWGPTPSEFPDFKIPELDLSPENFFIRVFALCGISFISVKAQFLGEFWFCTYANSPACQHFGECPSGVGCF